MVPGNATPHGGQGLREEPQVPRKEQAMYVTVRRYEGVTDPKEVGRRVKEGFAPLVSQIPGLVAYYFIDAGGGVLVSTSVFEDQAGKEEFNRRAADFVREHLAPLLPNPPQITVGEVVATKQGARMPM
jgi:hypothetical protein